MIKGKQQITPWSIYNKTLFPQDLIKPEIKKTTHFPKIKEVSLPNIKDSSIPKIQTLRQPCLTKTQRCSKQTIVVINLPAKQFTSNLPQFPPIQDPLEINDFELQSKQEELQKTMDLYILISIIKSQLKREQSENAFMKILNKEEQPTVIHLQNLKHDKSLLLDHYPHTKANLQKSVMVINLNEQKQPRINPLKRNLNQDEIKEILKKQINTMITNRMKVKGKAKQINYKS